MGTRTRATRILILAASFLFVAAFIFAQPVRIVPNSSASTRTTTLLNAFDLDGEAADADQIVTAGNGDLLDSKTFTITASPDVCRLVDMTVTDADSSITAGTVTVTGTDCLGYARVCTFDFSVVATRGSGVKTLPVTTGSGSGCYLGAVTSVVTSALTGEDGAGVDLMTLGYTSNSANGWAMWGTLLPVGVMGEHGVDPFASTYVATKITTTNALSTTVTGTNAFTDVVVGDLLLIPQTNSSGTTVTYERRVTARASASSITVNSSILIPTAGVYFSYKHLYFSTDPTDHLWIPVSGWKSAAFNYSVDSNTDTGGVTVLLECNDTVSSPDAPTGGWVTIDTVTTATGTAQVPTATALGPIDLTAVPFTSCRVGLKFGTGDDDDTGIEDINLGIALSK